MTIRELVIKRLTDVTGAAKASLSVKEKKKFVISEFAKRQIIGEPTRVRITVAVLEALGMAEIVPDFKERAEELNHMAQHGEESKMHIKFPPGCAVVPIAKPNGHNYVLNAVAIIRQGNEAVSIPKTAPEIDEDDDEVQVLHYGNNLPLGDGAEAWRFATAEEIHKFITDMNAQQFREFLLMPSLAHTFGEILSELFQRL